MNWNKKIYQRLVAALIAIKNESEAEALLRDLCTEGEIDELAKRRWTAEMLMAGVPYTEIEKKTGFSSTTVARVSKWLTGGKGGYYTVLSRLSKK